MEETHCPYKQCKLKCRTENMHKARYASITKNWRKRVTKFEQKMGNRCTEKVNWDKLKDLGIIYNFIPMDQEYVE